jgi:multiple sugar transport system permease protein
MNKAIKGIGAVRTTADPLGDSDRVSALMWSYMYEARRHRRKGVCGYGVIASPELMLLSSAARYRGDSFGVWKTTRNMASVLWPDCRSFDRGLYETLRSTERGPVRTFFQHHVPLLKPSLLVALLFRTLDAFRVTSCRRCSRWRAGNGDVSIYATSL